MSTHPLPSPPAATTAAALDFRLLVESASDIVAITDVDTTIRYVSGAVGRVLGYEPKALVGRRVMELLAPEAAAALGERLAPVAAGRSPSGEPRTYEFIAQDGSPRFLEVLATDLRANPRIGGLCVIARDVTERIAAERERAAVLERRRLAARVARVGLWEWDVESGAMFADDSVRAILRQHEGQRWTGPEDFVQRFVPADQEVLAATMRRAVTSAEPVECTVRLQLPDGGVRWLYLHGQQMAGHEGPRRVLGLVMDVSAQKRAELELNERRDRLALASDAGGLCAWTWQPLRGRLDLDERFATWVGLPAGASSLTFEQWQALLHPDDRATLVAEGTDLLEGRRESFDSVYRLRRPDGGWRWVLDRGRVAERDAQGRATRVYGIAIDIDERKRRVSELADQRLRLRLALDAARLGLWDWDVASRQLFVDERYCEIVGTTAEFVRSHPMLLHERLRPDDGDRLSRMARDVLAGVHPTLSFEGRLLRPDGQLLTISVHGAVSERDANGRPSRLTGTIGDLTETDRARLLASTSEEIARVGSFDIDLTRARFDWSAGTYRIFGLPRTFRPDVANTLALVAPGSRERARTLFAAARDRGEPFDAEFEVRDAAGAPVWTRMTARVETFGGRPVRLYGVVQDISARKQLERELLEVANREQQRLGSELHDGLGQALAGMSLMLEALAQQLADSQPALRAQLERLRDLVTQSIQDTRALAHGLAPVSLQRGGLEGALRRLAEQFEVPGDVRVELGLDLQAPLTLGEVPGNHLYRIAQEAVANAIRHGRAHRVAIAFHSAPGVVTLAVEDDGVGMPSTGPTLEGFGLRSMRYRAEALEGTLSIGPGRAGGTRVMVSCPQPEG